MTATEVNGVAVVADEPTAAPIKTRSGVPVLWVQTRTLLLADGTIIYGCVHCDYTRDNMHLIRPHLNKHRDLKTTGSKAPSRSMTLDQLLARVENLSKVEADRDHWKARAVKAEKSLNTLRNALKG
jgi:hypothetical protein